MFMGVLLAAMTAGLFSEVLARIIRAPVLLSLVPTLVPLIPGSDLYYTTSFLLRGQSAEFAQRGQSLLWQAGAIAFGIILVSCVTHIKKRSTP